MTLDVFTRSLGAALLLGALSSGCGDKEGELVYSSGVSVDKDTEAKDLSDDDKETFCKNLDEHVDVTVGFDEVARILCLPPALFTSTSRAACEELLDACMRDAPRFTLQRTNREKTCYDSLDSCEADVGTLETCANVNVKALRTLLERFTCDRFGDDDAEEELREAMETMDTANACAKVSSSCENAVLLI